MNVSHYPQAPLTNPVVGPQITELLQPFPIIRFMNWQQINNFADYNSDSGEPLREWVREWEDLPQESDNWDYEKGDWSKFGGVPLSIITKYANKLDVRPWLNIPTAASDKLIAQMVEYIIEACDQRPILEFSNEIWNAGFLQHHYAILQFKEAGPETDDITKALRWQASRTKVMAKAADGAADIVIGGQFFNKSIATSLLPICAEYVDALAVAPYLGRFQRLADLETVEPQRLAFRQLFRGVREEIETDVTEHIQAYRQLCDRYGVDLYAYEGGLHQVARKQGSSSEEQDAFEVEKKLFCEFNRSTLAGSLTRRLWEAWTVNGGGLYCPYSLSTNYVNPWVPTQVHNQFFGHCEINLKEIEDDNGRPKKVLKVAPLPKYRVTRLLAKRSQVTPA